MLSHHLQVVLVDERSASRGHENSDSQRNEHEPCDTRRKSPPLHINDGVRNEKHILLNPVSMSTSV